METNYYYGIILKSTIIRDKTIESTLIIIRETLLWRTISARVLKGGDTEIRFTLIVLETAYPFSLIVKSIIIQR